MNPQRKSSTSFWIVFLGVSCCQQTMPASLPFLSFFLIPVNSRLIYWYRHVISTNVEFAIIRYKMFQHLQWIGYFDDTWMYSGNFVTKSFGIFSQVPPLPLFFFHLLLLLQSTFLLLGGNKRSQAERDYKKKVMKWM